VRLMVRKIRYLNKDMCKFESSQKDESRWQLTDSSKAYRNTSAFKCLWWSMCAMVHCNYARQTKEQWGLLQGQFKMDMLKPMLFKLFSSWHTNKFWIWPWHTYFMMAKTYYCYMDQTFY